MDDIALHVIVTLRFTTEIALITGGGRTATLNDRASLNGGEPSSVEFCHTLGLDYVSCSPIRVPIARMAAAQAVLRGNPS